jgi:hypothetical protein
MKFPHSIFSVLDEHVQKIGELASFVADEKDRLSIRGGSLKIPDDFSSTDMDDVKKFTEHLGVVVKEKEKSKKQFFHISKKASDWLSNVMMPMRHGQMFAEMALVYAVAQTEAFMKDVIVELLSANSEMLRSNKSITYEEAASYRTIKNLHRGLAEREVGALSYEGIDGIGDYFSTKMKINLSDFEEWHSLREYFYRRNAIIHNKSIADNKYVAKTKTGKLGDKLFTNVEDVLKASDVMNRFMSFSFDKIQNKIDKKPSARRNAKKVAVHIGHVPE